MSYEIKGIEYKLVKEEYELVKVEYKLVKEENGVEACVYSYVHTNFGSVAKNFVYFGTIAECENVIKQLQMSI